LARLLETGDLESVNDALLSAAVVPGAGHLVPLLRLVDRDVATDYERTFAAHDTLVDRARVAEALRELATHDTAHGPDCGCTALARSMAPFAHALMQVPDSFYRSVGAILYTDIVLVLDPLAQPRLRDELAPRATQPEIH
jgi:hypothetical protein